MTEYRPPRRGNEYVLVRNVRTYEAPDWESVALVSDAAAALMRHMGNHMAEAVRIFAAIARELDRLRRIHGPEANRRYWRCLGVPMPRRLRVHRVQRSARQFPRS